MYRDELLPGGGGPAGHWCRACKQDIRDGDRTMRIAFNTDPHGHKGLTGTYHIACSKPFASLAQVVNLDPWSGR